MKTIKEHETIYIHIKKRTLNCILRGVFIWSVYLYMLIGYYFGLKPELFEDNFFEWWAVAPPLVMVYLLITGATLAYCFTVWDMDLS